MADAFTLVYEVHIIAAECVNKIGIKSHKYWIKYKKSSHFEILSFMSKTVIFTEE